MDQSTADAITKIEEQLSDLLQQLKEIRDADHYRDERISRSEDRMTALEKCLADFVGAFQTAIAAASR